MASPVDIIGIVDCYDIVALSLVMTAYWDFSPVVRTLHVYGYGRVPYTWLWDFSPWAGWSPIVALRQCIMISLTGR